MNICIITSVHPVFDSRIYFKQALSLLKAGNNVTIIARHNESGIVDGIRIVALSHVNSRLIRILRTPELLYAAWKQKADVYHFHDPELILLGLILRITTKRKIIYDVHEDYPEAILSKKWIPRIFRNSIAYIFNNLEKQAARHFDYVITATDGIATNFINISHVSSIKNYPIIDMFNIPAIHASSTFNVIYAGALTAERGITEIVKSFTMVSASMNINLLLYGKFESPSYQNFILNLRGAERIKYMGWIKPRELWGKMAHADTGIICLHPLERYKISLPIKLFEYMAAGLPVIASAFQLWEEIISKHDCGLLVNPLDTEAIAKAIEYLMIHREQARQMGENGRKAVIEKYNWEQEGKKLLDLYERLIGD